LTTPNEPTRPRDDDEGVADVIGAARSQIPSGASTLCVSSPSSTSSRSRTGA